MTHAGKPWYRPRNVLLVLLAAVVLALGWALWQVLEVYGAEPNPTHDTRAAQRAAFEAAAGVSAELAGDSWHALMDICDDVDAVRDRIVARYDDAEQPPRDEWYNDVDFGLVMHGRTLPGDIGPEREALAILARRGTFDRLGVFAAGVPGLRPDTRDGPLSLAAVIEDLGPARYLAQALGASMRVAAVEGDLEAAAVALDEMLAVARTMALQPYLMSYLTGAAIEALALGELGYELKELDFDERSCRMMLDSLDRHDAFPSVEYALEAERLYFHDWIQWSYSDDGEGDGYFVAAPPLDYGFAVQSGQSFFRAAGSRFFFATRGEILDVYDEFIDLMIAEGRLPPGEREDVLFAEDEFMESLSYRYELVRLLMGPLGKFVRNDAVRRMRPAGARVMVALELYRARHAAYPASLGALVPEVLPETPVDPLHGLPFGYRLLGDDEHGRPYLLYSVGLDGEDNGGAAPHPADAETYGWAAALMTPAVKGADFVINRPRQVWDE